MSTRYLQLARAVTYRLLHTWFKLGDQRMSAPALRCFAVAFLSWTIMAAEADAQNCPQRVVRIVNPFPPGGSVDVMARIHELGSEPGTAFRGDFAAFMKAETAKWGEVIRVSGAKAE